MSLLACMSVVARRGHGEELVLCNALGQLRMQLIEFCAILYGVGGGGPEVSSLSKRLFEAPSRVV